MNEAIESIIDKNKDTRYLPTCDENNPLYKNVCWPMPHRQVHHR